VNKLLFVLAVGLVASTGFGVAGGAVPCRPGFPNGRLPQPPPPPPPPRPAATTIYQRVVPATPTNVDRARLVWLLAGSTWTRLGSREQIRFIEPPGRQQFARPPEARDRATRALRIELTRDWRVLIDGTPYTITACQTQRPWRPRPLVVTTTCLESPAVSGGFGGQGYGGATYGGR